MPEAPINKAVPKSGCLAIKRTTIAIPIREMITGKDLGGSVFLLKIEAIAIGTIIFIISDG